RNRCVILEKMRERPPRHGVSSDVLAYEQPFTRLPATLPAEGNDRGRLTLQGLDMTATRCRSDETFKSRMQHRQKRKDPLVHDRESLPLARRATQGPPDDLLHPGQ